MQALLSNPPKRKRRGGRKTKVKRASRPRKVRKRRARRPTRKVAVMARKATRKRRTSRRRSSPRSRRRGAPVRRGFANVGVGKEMLFTGLGVAAGLASGPIIRKFVPPSLNTNPYVIPGAKVAAGFVALKYLRKYQPSLMTGLGLGLIGSGALDIVNASRAASGQPPLGDYGSGQVYAMGDYGEGGGDTVLMLEDGSQVEGYDLGNGEVVDEAGNVLATLEGDEDEDFE